MKIYPDFVLKHYRYLLDSLRWAIEDNHIDLVDVARISCIEVGNISRILRFKYVPSAVVFFSIQLAVEIILHGEDSSEDLLS